MAIFKDFFNKMTYGFMAFFLLSFAAIGMQQGGAEKPEFDIEIRKVTFKYTTSQEEVKFRARGVKNAPRPEFVPLENINHLYFQKVEELGIWKKKELSEYTERDEPEEHLKWRYLSNSLTQQNEADKAKYNKRKSIAGEIAANALFEHLGYKRLEVYYEKYRQPLFQANYEDKGGEVVYEKDHSYCTTQNRSNHGIDAIFIHENEIGKLGTSQPISHIIINESKAHAVSELKPSQDFHVLTTMPVRQSHSRWNEKSFSKINDGCIATILGNYAQQTIIRTATLLDPNGQIKLYEVRDSDNQHHKDPVFDVVRQTYASQASPHLHIHHMYSQFQNNIKEKGYIVD